MKNLRLLRTVLLVVSAAVPTAAAGAIFTVNSTVDAVDAQIDGTCATAGGVCTLRAAIQEANANVDHDDINLPLGKYTLKVTGSDDAAASGDLDVSSDVTILGAGPKTIIVGKGDRVVQVLGAGVLTMRDLVITKGTAGSKHVVGVSGGCIRSDGTLTLERVVVSNCFSSGRGGGIAAFAGSVTLTNVTVTKSKTLNDDGGGMAVRGSTTATLTNVTISKNKAGDQGGGLYIDNGGTVVATNCTVTGNSAAYAQGGIYVFNNSTLTITNATIVGNKSKEQPFAGIGGGINRNQFAGAVTVENVILSKNKPANCSGGFVLKGGNLEDGHSCGFPPSAFDIAKLGLAGLKSVGGAPATFGLKKTSPAIDFGVDADCPATDERGQARVDVVGVGTTTCDSGAFEFVPPPQ